MLRTIDRYIVREIIPPFAFALLVFTFLLIIPPIMDQAEQLIAKGVPTESVVRILLTLVPQALGVTIPMALLIGILIGLGRLSGDREVVALQACGVSLYRLLRPIVLLAGLGWAATSWVMIVSIPDANQRFREITYDIVATRAEHDVKPRVFFEDFPGMVLYVRDLAPRNAGWIDVFLADTRGSAGPDIYLAKRGRILLDREKQTVQLVLEQVRKHTTSSEGPEAYDVSSFDFLAFNLDPKAVFPRTGVLQRGYNEMDIPALEEEIELIKSQGGSPHNAVMAIQRKFSIPTACLVLATIGLGLGVSNRKDGKLASFVLGIGVIFVYYIVMYMAESMAKGALVPPALAMWLPNLVLGVAGVLLLIRRGRFAERPIVIPLPFRRIAAVAATANGAPVPVRRGQRVVVVIRVPHVWVPKLNILDWYVVGIYMRIFALGFIGMIGIFYIATFIDLSDKLFKGQTTAGMLLSYLWFATPQFVYYVLPISALIATLVAVGLLMRSSELIVMRACGISLYRAAAPLVILGVFWSGALFSLEEYLLAPANRQAKMIRHVIIGGAPGTFDVLNRQWLVGREGSIYHYAAFNSTRAELQGLSVFEINTARWQLAARTFASGAKFDGGWIASRGWVRQFSADGAGSSYAPFDSRALALEPLDYFVTEEPDAERMTYDELKRYIEELSASGFNVVPHAVALQRKLSFPFVTVIMTLIGVPFAVTTGRRGAMFGIGAGLVLAISYWIVISVFAAIGSAGLITPVLAAWAPNVMVMAGAAYLLLSVRT